MDRKYPLVQGWIRIALMNGVFVGMLSLKDCAEKFINFRLCHSELWFFLFTESTLQGSEPT